MAVDDAQERAVGLVARGNELESAGLLDEAQAHYESAVAVAPRMAKAHLNRGNVLLLKGDTTGRLTRMLPP